MLKRQRQQGSPGKAKRVDNCGESLLVSCSRGWRAATDAESKDMFSCSYFLNPGYERAAAEAVRSAGWLRVVLLVGLLYSVRSMCWP